MMSTSKALVSDLLAWYDTHARDLPWRRTRDPYAIWISEIMLQQTQVATVLPYYQRFLERYPDVESLAATDIDQVLADWSGLGYYRRARQMHRAAIEVAASGGNLPTSAAALLALPGIGPYTSAAIASIAFGERIAVIDGNVERLMARWLALEGDVKRAAIKRRLLAAASSLVDAHRPGDSNQALMELGATVCRPRQADCPRCPLAKTCLGKAEPLRYPTPRQRRATIHQRRLVAIVRNTVGDQQARQCVLMFRRPPDSELMAGFWQLPEVPMAAEGDAASNDARTLRATATALAERYGGQWQLDDHLTTVRHAITHRSIELLAYSARLIGSADAVAEGPEAAWVGVDEILNGTSGRALSSAVGKVIHRL